MGPSGNEDDDAEADGWEDLADAPIEVDPVDAAYGGDDGEVVVEGDLGEYQQPRGLPQPVAPSREARRLHELTHLPYASWCWCCVSGRKNNSPHFRSQTGSDRDLPLLVLDYCFVRNEKDEELAKVLVGKLYPSRKVFACVWWTPKAPTSMPLEGCATSSGSRASRTLSIRVTKNIPSLL